MPNFGMTFQATRSHFTICTAGMLAGLLFDWQQRKELTGALCMSGNGQLLGSVSAHISMFPGMHSGALIAALVTACAAASRETVPCRQLIGFFRSAACGLFILGGMLVGSGAQTMLLAAGLVTNHPINDILGMMSGMALAASAIRLSVLGRTLFVPSPFSV